jgi:hypothetical protein
MTADPPRRYRLMRPVGPRRAGPAPRVQRHTNLSRYPTRATSRRLWAAGCGRRVAGGARGVRRYPAYPACTRASIHAAKQIRRLGLRNKRRRGDAVRARTGDS